MDRDRVEPQVESLPGERARRQVDYHHGAAAPSTYVYDFVWDYTAPAVGPFCTDLDGNVLMDFTSHVGAAPLGYNHPELLERLDAFDLFDPVTAVPRPSRTPSRSATTTPAATMPSPSRAPSTGGRSVPSRSTARRPSTVGSSRR
jgi:4-aminobutyrate aminotransferase